ncbi:AsmA domain protein [Leptospira fainei serovar Hurstbridge str. BUT 6]|uniref:AsmA domain protein n=1 Tax=Leptospira fainei serovar Hurstbridge str. BUT 6 TaxID=1193011 RepID=S3VBN7_9LEPT|nr:AsmA domain protein [Leptospira fainei]EPG73900.1 AsmA domain protein [Leptospira fainei serovar Hurstbridge str. BUT 6]
MERKSFRRISVSAIIFLLLLAAAKEGAEWYFVRRILDLRAVKELSRNFINEELGRAVALGVVEYEFPNHVFIEDLKISSDEDFAAQHLIFKANKIELVLRGLWKGTPSVRAIRIRDAQISLDLEDKISGEILGYIHKVNIPEIRLENTTVSISKGEKKLLEEVRGVDFLIRKEGSKINVGISDSVFPWPGLRYVNGTFATDIGSKGMSLSLDFRNARASAIGGLYSEFSPFFPQSGKISGKALLETDGTILKVSGKTEFSGVTGEVLQDLPLREEPWLWKNVNLDHEWARSSQELTYKEYHRIYDGDDFLELARDRTDKGLRSWNLKLEVADIDRLRDFLPFTGQLESFGGGVKLFWKGKETGNFGDWLKFESSLAVRNFRWKDADLDLKIDEGIFEWNLAGIFGASLKGSQFGFPLTAKASGKTAFKKALKGDGSAYYPLQGEYNLELDTESLVLEDYLTWYRSLRQMVREDVRTRMEKLIPEIRFVRTPIFKYFLEFPTGNLKVHSKQIRLQRSLSNMGELSLNVKLIPYQSRLEGKLSGVADAKISSYFTYGNESPYFNFDFEGVQLPWKVPAFRFCGKDLIPETVTGKGNIRFFGNNFLDFYDHFNLSLQEVRLNGLRWKGAANFPLPLQPDFEMEFDYSDPGNPPLRNLSWKSGNFNATAAVYVEPSALRYSITGSSQSTSSDSFIPAVSTPFFTKFRETKDGCILE